MKQKITILLAILCIACTGNKDNNEQTETVVVDLNSDKTFTNSDFIKSIELIPIKDTALHIYSYSNVITHGTEYIILNTKQFQQEIDEIIRVDSKGNILNYIGHKGRGDKEYISAMDVSINNDTVSVFANNLQIEYLYLTNGTYIGNNELEYWFERIRKVNNKYYYYRGFAYKNDARFIIADVARKNENRFLAEDVNIIHCSEHFNPIIVYNDKVFVRELLNHKIYAVHNDSIYVKYMFDFDKYGIPDEFYKGEDALQSMMKLLEKDFASLDKFLENDNWVILECKIQKTDGTNIFIYPVKNKKTGKWQFLQYTSENDTFVQSLKYLTDDSELLFLVDAHVLKYDESFKRELVVNPEVLDSITENDNPVILKCKLKN
jgi:hypothetical protein